jgi:hypothetical protein
MFTFTETFIINTNHGIESEAENEPQLGMQTEPEVATEEAKPEANEMDLAVTVEEAEDDDDVNIELKDTPIVEDASEQATEVSEPISEIPEVKFDYASDVTSTGIHNTPVISRNFFRWDFCLEQYPNYRGYAPLHTVILQKPVGRWGVGGYGVAPSHH